MIQKEVSAKLPVKEGRNAQELSATIFIDMPENIDEALDWASDEAILSNCLANFVKNQQAGIRTDLLAGMSEEEIQAKRGKAVPGVAVAGAKADPQAAFIAKFKMASADEQAKMLELLREAAAAA